MIRVYSIVPKYQKTVILRGNTANPGRFAWHEGMRVSELIPDKESLLTRNYWWRRAQMGLPAPEFEPVPGFANQRQPSDNHPIALDGFRSSRGQRVRTSKWSQNGPDRTSPECRTNMAQDNSNKVPDRTSTDPSDNDTDAESVRYSAIGT